MLAENPSHQAHGLSGPAGSCTDETVDGHAEFMEEELRESKLSRPAADRLFWASSYALENRRQVLVICDAPVSPCVFLVGYRVFSLRRNTKWRIAFHEDALAEWFACRQVF